MKPTLDENKHPNLGHASEDNKMKGAYLRHSTLHEKKHMQKKKNDTKPSNMAHG